MPKVSPILTNFSAGEVSPLLDGRVDISQYYNSAKILENFLILPAGGIRRRPGTYYVDEVKDSTRKTRLIPFQFSTSQTYQIEVGDRYMRFYQNRGQITSGGSAYEISTSYLEAGLFDGTGDYLTIPDHADFSFGAGDFTIDFWVRFNAINTGQMFISQVEDANNEWFFRIDASNTVEIYFIDDGVVKGNYSFVWTGVATNTRYHLAVVRSTTTCK